MIIRKISLLNKAPKITGYKTVHSPIGKIQMGVDKNGKIIPGVVLGSGFPAYKWPKEQIIKEIQKLKNEGSPLNSRHAQVHYSKLFSAARSQFGGWRKFIIAAGLDISEIELRMPRTREQIIKEIQKLKSEDSPLNARYAQEHYSKLFSVTRLHFGGWREAIIAAGLDISEIELHRTRTREQRNAANEGTERAEKVRSLHKFYSYIAEFKKIMTRYEKCKALALDKNTPKNIVLKMINSIIKDIRTLNISIRHLALSSEIYDCPTDVIVEISTIRSLHLIEIGKSLVSLRDSYGENK